MRPDGFAPPMPESDGFTSRCITTLPRTLGVITRYRAGTYRVTAWRADLYTMTTVPSEGFEPPPPLCKSDTLPLRQPGWLLLPSIPGRIRTRNAKFVAWHDVLFTTGTRSPWQIMKDQGVATATGLEPATPTSTEWCSTIELYGLVCLGSRERTRTST